MTLKQTGHQSSHCTTDGNVVPGQPTDPRQITDPLSPDEPGFKKNNNIRIMLTLGANRKMLRINCGMQYSKRPRGEDS